MMNGISTLLGQIGGTINIDIIYRNLLEQNIALGTGMWSPWNFRDFVTSGGIWDYKIRYNQAGRRNTIWGYVNIGTQEKTNFSFQGQTMEAQDIGNHHFGVVGKACGLFPENTLLVEAGRAQMTDKTSKPEWQKYNIVHTPQGDVQGIMLPPYGDDPRDQYWIQAGFDYFKNRSQRP